MAGLFGGVENELQGLDPSQVRHIEAWGTQQAELMVKDPLNYGYPPHEGQLQVHRSTSNEVLLIAANRWGKTVCGLREVLWRATGTHPYKKTKPHKVIWCGFLNFGFYNKTTKPAFDEWVPKEYLIQFHETEKWATFRRRDGGVCTVYFLSYMEGRESWQGGTVDYIWLDEELPYDIYKEASARLISTRGQMLMTQTPVSGLGWAYDTLYLPAMAKARDTQIVQGALAEKDEGKPLKVGKVLVPHLDYEAVLRFAKLIKDPDERDIRVFGEFKGRSGGVFKMFDPTIHVVPSFAIPPYFEKWGGVDPGYHGFAAVLTAMDPGGRIYVAGEYYSQQESHQQRLSELWAMAEHIYKPAGDEYIPMYCDTANPQDILELNIWAQKVGARLSFAQLNQGLKAKVAGIQRIQEYLTPDLARARPQQVLRPRPRDGEPMLYIFDTLQSAWQDEEEGYNTSRLVWELQRYLWQKTQQGNKFREDEPDKSSAGGAHMLDAFRYTIMARLGAPDPPKEEKQYGDPLVREHMEMIERRLLESQRM